MTLTEKQAWVSLLAMLAIAACFVAAMTDGWTIPDHAPRHLWTAYILVAAATAASEGLIGLWVGHLRRTGSVEDERDLAIVARADRIGLWTGFGALNLMVWQVLWQATFAANPEGARALDGVGPDFSHLATLFLLLMGVTFITHLAKQAAVILLGRV